VDLVLDLLGGETQTRSYAVLKPGGTLVATAQPPKQEEADRHNVHAMMMQMKPTTAGLRELAQLLDAGKLRTEVTRIFPLAQAKEAWEYGKSGHTRGKVILEVPQ
jgi:NADPH:quinone reductase-like Zn-dependent oxidoreductase